MTPSLEMRPSPGYTPMVGSLVAMLEYTRVTTLDSVADLTVADLDHQHDAKANPIGALLAHITAVEWVYTASTVGGPTPSDTDWAEWGPLLRLEPAVWDFARGRPVEWHVERLRAVRGRTLEGFRAFDDAWLEQPATLSWARGAPTNLWAWYHVMEDELNHRGQIRWLRSRLHDEGVRQVRD